MIKQCTEIASHTHLFQLWKCDDEHHWISIIEDGRISNIDLDSFDSNELTLLMRHVQGAYQAVKEAEDNGKKE